MPIENKPPTPTNIPKDVAPAIDMEAFRNKIKLLVDDRMLNQADKFPGFDMIELTKVNVEELVEADALIWNKVEDWIYAKTEEGRRAGMKEIPVTHEEVKTYRQEVAKNGPSSRSYFYAVIANRLMPLMLEDELKEIEEAEKLKAQSKA